MLLLSVPALAFRGAWLEPPQSRKACSLRGLKAHAIPAGVERLHSKQRVQLSKLKCV